MRGAEQRPVRRDNEVRDRGSQAGQEVSLANLVVLPLDEHRLDASTQQISAWTDGAEKVNIEAGSEEHIMSKYGGGG